MRGRKRETLYEEAHEEYGSVVGRVEENIGCAATLSAAISDRAKRTSGDLDSRLYSGKMARLSQELRLPQGDMVHGTERAGSFHA